MKIANVNLDGPNVETIVLIRNGQDIVFQARAVLDYNRFNALCPKPIPKRVKRPSGEEVSLVDAPDYSKALDIWAEHQTNYTIVEALKATPGLEWDNVKDDDPQSWSNYQAELRSAHFTEREIVQIVNCCWSANGINQTKLDEAMKRFLAGQGVVLTNSTSPNTEGTTIPSGEPANVSA